MNYDLDFIIHSVQGKLISSPHKIFAGFCADNRDPDIKGKLFIPLVGEHHDAHKYVSSAIEKGATGVIVHGWSDDWEALKDKATFIEVGDTLIALQHFAKAWRKTFSGKVLGLTGSNGKTTTKDFLAQILKNFATVSASQGSFNNHWGVPFTLLNTDPATEFYIVEMGMNHAGEIAGLVAIADPDLVTVTNVGRAHMGNFRNGVDGVAAAKEEIYESSKASAQLLFNIDNVWTRQMFEKYMERPSFTYSTQNFSADVYFKVKEKRANGLTIEGQIGGVLGTAELSFWGDHNVKNLSAAVAMAYISGIRPEQIWSTLKDCHCGWGRNQWVDTKSGIKILFDGYNANPDSFQELLNNVSDLMDGEQKVVAVFGEMLELGEESHRQHRALGKAAGQLPWEDCLFVGPSEASFLEGWHDSGNSKKPITLSTYEESLDLDLLSMVDKQSLIVVKGSRGGALERIVERFDPIGFTRK